MQRTLVTALVAAVVFAVGGWFVGSMSGKVTILKHPHKYKDCRGQDCAVTIAFDCIDPHNPTPSTCEPYAVEEVILVTPNYKIEFTIDNTINNSTANFAFDQTDGIKFTSSNADNYFPCQPQGQKYRCDNNIPNGTPVDVYKYAIHIQGFSPVDPWVVN